MSSMALISSGSTSKLTSYLFDELRRTNDRYKIIPCKFSYSRIFKSGKFEVGNMAIIYEGEPTNIADPKIRAHLINKFDLEAGPKILQVEVLYEAKSVLNKVYVLTNVFLPGTVDINEELTTKPATTKGKRASSHGNAGRKMSPEFCARRKEIITEWWAAKKAAKVETN